MTNKIAIDVALLPPDKIMDLAIDLNRRFVPAFELNKTDRLPHLTLYQFVIDQSDLEEMNRRMEKITSDFKPIALSGSTDVHSGAFLGAKETSDFNFNNEGAIAKLHSAIVKVMQGLVSQDAESEAFYDEYIQPKSLNWIRNFIENASFDRYSPHITLGAKMAIDPPVRVAFSANRLAACHLGNYNTCRKILFETKLKQSSK